jgi:aspartate/methionine/tyrosine aminotransferase
MRFSNRTDWDVAENEFAAAVRRLRESRREVFDLTVSNPTVCGFDYGGEALLAPLAEAGATIYEPDPLGMRGARQVVGEYYREHGASVAADRICLTTSTSEAYSFLFRMLCEGGDEVLVAQPSYPLFDFIARLDDVKLVGYPLWYSDGWHVDFGALELAVTERTRAVVVVHPNNPTGNFCSAQERERLQEFCAQRGLTLIVDEVFLDYALEGVSAESFAAGESDALTFVLSGLSKVCGLPQMKVSWIVAAGPETLVSAAMERLEVIGDTFLSVNAPMQHALPVWLRGRAGIQGQIRARMRANLAVLDAALVGSPVDRLVMQGGWTAVLRVPRTEDFVAMAMERGVVVQPGEFYGLGAGRLVASLLTSPDVWARGLALLPLA